jgi:hypothetical protein
LSSREKNQNPTKPQDLITMKISEGPPNQYRTLILMAAGRQKIEIKFLEHLRRKDIRELLNKDLHKAAKEVGHPIVVKAMTEGLTHSNLHTACITGAQSTTTPKIAPSFRSQKRKWSKILHNLRINQYPEKSITPWAPHH